MEEELVDSLDTLDSSCESITSGNSNQPSDPLSKKPKKGRLMTPLSDVLGTDDTEGNDLPMDTAGIVHREVVNFISLVPAQVCHPLEWWRENSPRLPLLAKLARKYLCLHTTLVPLA